jgi:uncharacterized YccA/Bax inhibitor family protein
MKFGLSQFNKTTPKALRHLGYALLALSVFAATTWMEYLPNSPRTAEILIWVGAAGKFITSLFGTNEETTNSTPGN